MRSRQRSRKKEQYWRTQIEQWQTSGKTISVYCRVNGISPATFHWWRRELRLRDIENVPDGEKESIIPRFAEVKVIQDPPAVHKPHYCNSTGTESGIEIVLPGNRCIRVYRGFDVSVLLQLLSVLEHSPC
jgi:transposase-like protein